jgi:hypothetical protein
MKDTMITYLRDLNKNAIKNGKMDEIITVLFYGDVDNVDFVTDYSPFINSMSEGLRIALTMGQTLTTEEQSELNLFRIENYFY